MSEPSPDQRISKTLLAFLTIVPTIATAITGFLAYRVNSEVEHVNAELKKFESLRRFDLEIYHAVKESLKGNEKDQEVALALVISIGQEPFRSALLGALENSAAPEIVAEARSQRQLKEQPSGQEKVAGEAPNGVSWGAWDFDLFYCEGSPPEAQNQARSLATAMLADGAKGRIRVRPLTKDKNAEAGYGIRGNIVRRTSDEVEMARKFIDFAKRSIHAPPFEFEEQAATQRTPWYISAFLCP
jgi:hypothetical protein